MNGLQSRILTWLDIEADETKPVGLCFAIAFTWGFSQMLSWTAANTLFLKYYNASELPFISIATAVLLPLSGLLFIRLNRSLRYSTQFFAFALLFVAAPLLFRGLLENDQWRWPSLAYAIWYYMEVALSTLVMDTFLNRMFNLRQVKRVYGPISTGSDLAGVPAGFLVGLIVSRSGVENLLLLSAAISSMVLILFFYVERCYRSKFQVFTEPEEEEEADAEKVPAMPVSALFKHPLVLCILGMGALNEFNLEFINNAFYSRTEIYLPEPEEMAAFLGQFFAIASVFSSVIQMLASSRLMKWIGIGGCLIVGPILVAASLLVFITSDYLAFAAAFVFATMASAKFIQYTVLVNVNDVVQFTLIRSLPTELQDRVLALSGTIMAPILGGLSGLALLGMIHLFGATATGISMVVVCIMIAIVFIGLRAAREYRANLTQILNNRSITGVELPLHDPGTAKMLQSLADDPDPQTALRSLELLGRQMHSGLKPALQRALHHQDAQVRTQAATVYLRLGGEEDLPILREQLMAERDPVVLRELLPALARAGKDEVRDVLVEYLQDKRRQVVQGACIGLVRYCSGEQMQQAVNLLSEMSESKDVADRVFVAQTLGRIRASACDGLILPLLHNPDAGVRSEAIQAASRLSHPQLGPALLANLDDPDMRPRVIQSLIYGSGAFLPGIDRMLDQPGQKAAVQRDIIGIYGRMRSDESVALLRKRLGELDPQLQQEVVKALAQCRYRCVDEDIELLDTLFHRYAECATWLLACEAEIESHKDNNELLLRAIDHELRKVKELLFMLVEFLHPGETIDYIRFAYFHSQSEDKISAGVELLDNILRGRHREYLLPILEGSSLERRLAVLLKHFPLEDGGLVMRLVEIMNGRYSHPGPWLQAVTLDFVSRDDAISDVSEICSGDEIQDTARRWLKRSTPATPAGMGALSVVEKVAALKQATIFKQVPDEIIAEYAPETVERLVPAGTRIISEGEPGSSLYVIVDGQVRVCKGEKTIAEMKDGDIFGELSALCPEPRSADVDAVSETRLLELKGAIVQKMVSEHSAAADGIMRVLCQRIQTTIREHSYEDTGSFAIVRDKPAQAAAVELTAALQDVEKTVLLKTVEIFSSLPDAVLMHLAGLAREQWLESETLLFRAGDFGTSMYVIVDGEVAVHDEDRLIAKLGRGEIIGELALLTSEVRSGSVTALRRTRLLKITRRAMAELMWDHPQMARCLVQVLAVRLRNMVTGKSPGGGDRS